MYEQVAWDQVAVKETCRGGVVQFVRLGGELAYKSDVEEATGARTQAVELFQETVDVGSDRDAQVAGGALWSW